MNRTSSPARRPLARWILLVLGLSVALSACWFPHGYDYGYDRGLTRGQMLNLAREAVHDYIIRRFGRDASPRIAGVEERSVSRVEAQVVGRVSFYRSPRGGRERAYFRCIVDRMDGRVRGIDLY